PSKAPSLSIPVREIRTIKKPDSSFQESGFSKLLLQQCPFQILQHDIQRVDSALCCIPYCRVFQVHNMSVFVCVRSLHKLIFHNLLCKLCALCVNCGVTVHDKDVFRITFHYEFERCFISVGGGIHIRIYSDVFKPDLISDQGASSVVSENVEAAACAHSDNSSFVFRKFGQRLDALVKS